MRMLALLLFTTCLVLAEEKVRAKKQPVLVTTQAVIGKVSFLRPPSNRRQTCRVGTILRKNDVVYTEVESSVELVFESGSKLFIEENSLVRIDDLADSEKRTRCSLKLRTGKILFNIQNLVAKGSFFEFKTESMLAGVRGTKGGIGSWGGKSLAYLESGSLQLIPFNDDNFVTLEALSAATGAKSGIDIKKYADLNELKIGVIAAEKELKKQASGGDVIKKALDDFRKDRKSIREIKSKKKPSDRQLFYPVDE